MKKFRNSDFLGHVFDFGFRIGILRLRGGCFELTWKIEENIRIRFFRAAGFDISVRFLIRLELGLQNSRFSLQIGKIIEVQNCFFIPKNTAMEVITKNNAM